MQIHWRQFAFAAALSVGAAGVVAVVPAVGQEDQNHHYERNGAQAQRTDPDTYANHPEYSNNEYYRTGNDEGYQDYQAKKRRDKHEHQYRSDDDRKAHDYGYDEGWSGRTYRRNQSSRNGQTSGENQDRDRDNERYRNQDNRKHDKNDDHDRDMH